MARGQEGDDAGNGDAEIIGEGRFGAKQVARYGEGAFAHILEQHRRGLEFLEHPGNLQVFRGRQAHMDKFLLLIQLMKVIS